MTHLVRPAQVSDADAIGVLHVQVWRETYAGLMPADLLQSLSPVQRAEMWRGWLTRGTPGAYVCEEGQAVVGFGVTDLGAAEWTVLAVCRVHIDAM